MVTSGADGPVRGAPVARLWLAVCCGYLAIGATFQILPGHTRDRFGAGPAVVGAVVGIASLGTALSRPPAGRGADRGRARRVILLAASVGAIGGLGHLAATSLPVLFVARLLLGIGEGALFTASVSWVLRHAAGERRGGLAGLFGLSMWGGLAAGPLVAVWLASFAGVDGVWYAVIALPLVALALASTTGDDAPVPGSPMKSALLPAPARLPGITFGLASYGYGTVAALLILRLDDSAIGGETAGIAVFATAFLITRVVGSPLTDRIGGVRVGIASTTVEALGLAQIAYSDSLAGVLCGVALAGAGVALMYPAMVAITVRRTPDGQHGAGVGLMTSFWDVGILVAGPVGGVIAAAAGYRLSFAVAAALALGSCLLIGWRLGPAPAAATAPAPGPSRARQPGRPAG